MLQTAFTCDVRPVYAWCIDNGALHSAYIVNRRGMEMCTNKGRFIHNSNEYRKNVVETFFALSLLR